MIINKDCLEALKELPDNSIDSIVTDPPYGLSFMGKKWDYDVPSTEIWSECLRVLKPGGYLLAFAGTRTQHRMAVRIEDAGFEIRDMIAWVYGSGFPKSLNIGKAVDKLQGNERETYLAPIAYPDSDCWGIPNNNISGNNWGVVGADDSGKGKGQGKAGMTPRTKGTSEWEGWGTALKPALEPITVARKPIEGTVAENCLKWGVGGINIDESRVNTITEADKNNFHQNRKVVKEYKADSTLYELGLKTVSTLENSLGRFPANLIHDGSEEVLELFPDTGNNARPNQIVKDREVFDGVTYKPPSKRIPATINDSGSAARFFYCAKASKKERNLGCDGLEEKIQNNTETNSRTFNDRCLTCKKKFVGSTNTICHCPSELKITDKTIYKNKNNHPTVKPIKLMEYLINLVSKPGHTVLDPFAGSGTTGIACKKLNRNFIGVERDEEYCKIAEARINNLTL